MTNKHTPGPWALQAGRSIVTSSGSFYLTYGTEKGSGAPLFRDFCELDRNARLISAAPDLLSALQALHEFTREHSALYRNGISLTNPLYRNVYDAIAKATGQG